MTEVFVVAHFRCADAVYASGQSEAGNAVAVCGSFECAADVVGHLYRNISHAFAQPHLNVVSVYMLVVAARCQYGQHSKQQGKIVFHYIVHISLSLLVCCLLVYSLTTSL